MQLYDSQTDGTTGKAASADTAANKTIQVIIDGTATCIIEATEGAGIWYQIASVTVSGVTVDGAPRAALRARQSVGPGRIRVFLTTST